jgi:chemotaxis family two-component system response regulator Rcp1
MPVKSILLIEDNPGDIHLVTEALELLGLKDSLIQMDNGEDALAYLGQIHPLPHFIILDVNLPGMNGFDILMAIKDNERWQNINVALFSSARIPEDILHQNLFNRYIIKPFGIEQYFEVIQSLCTEWLK